MTLMTDELKARIRTGVPLAVAVFLVIMTPGMIVGLVVIVFAVIGSGEFTSMFSKKEMIIPEWMLPGCSILMGLGAIGGSNGLHAMFLVSGMAWVLYQFFFSGKSVSYEVNQIGIGLLGLLIVGWSLSHITLLKSEENGTVLIFFLIIVISFSDIFAYFGGKHYGKTLLAPSVSPKKTLEGSIIGASVASIFAALFAELVLDFFWLTGLLLGFFISVAGQLGDLLESRLKRICGVKDSGSLLPGHGGILDRVDGYLIAAPLFYYLVQIL